MLNLRQKISKVIVATLFIGMLSVVQGAAPANAADVPFTCSASFYQVSATNKALFASSIATGANAGKLQYTQIGANGSTGLNGAGYNTADNFIYAMSSASLYKVDAAGVVTNLGTVTASTANGPAGGDFIAPNKLLEVGGGAVGANAFWLVNTVTRATIGITSTGVAYPTGAGDFAFKGNYGWGLYGNTLYRIDATNLIAGTSTTVAVSSYTVGAATSFTSPDTSITLSAGNGFNPTTGSAYGAAYVDQSGNLYFYDNTAHNVVKIPVDTIGGTPAPKSILVGGAAALTALGAPNDGASCPSAPSPYDPPTPVNDTYWMAAGTTPLVVNSANSIVNNDKSSGAVAFVVKNVTVGATTTDLASSGVTVSMTKGTASAFTNAGQFSFLPTTSTTYGTQTFTYYLIESASPSRTSLDSATVTINIIDMPAQSPTSGTTGSPYSYQITSNGPTTGATFTLDPTNANCLSAAGLSLSTGGLISGTPTATTNVSCSYQMTLNGVTVTRTLIIPLASTSYTVTYNINGGTGTTPASQTTTPTSNSVVLDPALSSTFSRNGYTFVSWLESTTAQNTFLPGVTYTPTQNVTMVAQWLAQSATVTYNANGGTGAPNSQSLTYPNTITISSTSPTGVPTGYTFGGWYTAASGGTSLGGTTYSTPTSLVLYAHWTPIVYHVYYFDTSTVAAATLPATQNSTVPSPATIAGNVGASTPSGYTFAGWIETSTGTTYNVGTIYTLTRNINLTAVWTQNHTITYDANGGSGSMPTNVSWSGNANQTIGSPSGLSRAGFTLAGWNTQSNGSGQDYNAGDIYSLNGNLVLYAIWIPITYVVTYDANGGANNPGNQTFSVASPDVIANGNTLTRAGYTFAGWWTDNRSGSGTQYAPGTTYGMPADLQLFAQWVANSYHISYNGNGANGGNGPVAGDTTTFTFGSNPVIAGNAGPWTLTNAKFTGWNTKADGSGDGFAAGDVYTAAANLELYAIWVPIGTYTVTYDPNGGSGGPGSQRFLAGGSVTILNASSMVRYGYTFVGWWNDTSTATGANYAVGDTYSKLADLTLYAVWVGNEHEVTYDANGGLGITPGTQKFKAPNSVTISDTNTATPITKDGYLFDGWNTAADGSGTDYASGDIYNLDANLLLYASWTPEEYTVMYDSNGGTGFVPSDTFTVESPATIRSASALTGPSGKSTFGGWNTAADGSGTPYTVGDPYGDSSDLDLYAMWIPDASYAITYDPNNGTLPSGMPGTVIYTGSTSIASGEPTRTGYIFAGWNTSLSGSGSTYTAGTSVTTQNIRLYAMWTAVNYRVVYDANGGVGAPTPQSFTVALGAIIKATTGMTRTGYTVAGWWNSASTATGSTYAAGDDYKQAADLTLYAIWVPTNYEIAYDLNGGTGTTPATDTFTVEDPGVIGDGSSLTRTGYHFGGWAEERTNPTNIFTFRDTFNEPRDLELFAIWVPDNEFVVTYDLNGAIGTPPASQIFMGGTTVSIQTVPVNPPGLAFISWNTQTNGGGTDYFANIPYSDDADLHLFALWSPIVYHINYHANGGSGTAPATQNFTVVHPANIQTQGALTATGYRFDGWNTAPDASGVSYIHGDTYLEPADIDLYAIWTCETTCSPLNQNTPPSGGGGSAPAPIYYRIVYLGNGASGSVPTSATVQAGTSIVVLAPSALTNPGYTFLGWNTESNGSGNTYAPGTPYVVGGNVNLYAMWKLNPVTTPVTPTPTPSTTPQPTPATTPVAPGGTLTRLVGTKAVLPNQIVPVKEVITLEKPGTVEEVLVNGQSVDAKVWASGAITLTNLVGPKDDVRVVELINGKKAQVQVSEGNDPISLANVNFNTASYVLDASAKAILNKVVAVVKQHGFTTIELVGHTDTAGVSSGYDNQTLSHERAVATMAYLKAKLGALKVKITVDAKAHVDPVAANTTAAGRAANRRVEIVVH